MNEDFKKLERESEHDLARLDRFFREEPPDVRLVASIQTAVKLEAGRLKTRKFRWLTLRAALGTAAAFLLTMTFFGPMHGKTTNAPMLPMPEATFGDWLNALDETDQHFNSLLSADWLAESTDWESKPGDVEKWMDNLQESLQSFEGIIGA